MAVAAILTKKQVSYRPSKDIHDESHFCYSVTAIVFSDYQIVNGSDTYDYAEKVVKVVLDGCYIGWDIVIFENVYDVIEDNMHLGQDFQGCNGIDR